MKALRYNILILKFLFAFAGVALLFWAGSGWAGASRGVPVTQGVVEGTRARIVFEWQQPGQFTAYLKDRTLTVTFDRNVSPEFGTLLRQLHPYIIGAQRKADGKTIVLTMDQPYRIRTFRQDNSNGIILLDIDPTRHRSYKPKKPAAAPAVLDTKANQLNGASPAAGGAAEKQPAPVKTVPVKEPVKEAAAPVKEAVAKEAAQSSPKPADAPPEAVAGKDAEAKAEAKTKEEATAKEEKQPEVAAAAASPAPAADGKLKVIVSAADESATLRFPFTERAATAVFIRSGVLWVVFNKQIPLDLSDFDALPRTVIGRAELVSGQAVTAMRIPVSNIVVPTIAKEAGKYEWTVLLLPESRLLSNALNIEVRTDPPAPPHVFVPVLEMADSIELKDPQVGDTMVVTPLFSLGEGILKQRDFIEFSLLETAQGIVVAKKSDDIDVIQLRNGLRISPHQSITLTPGLPPIKDMDRQPQALQSTRTLFPYEDWKVPEHRDRNRFISELQRRIVESSSVDEVNRARVRLAQLYLGEGLAPEAIAQLESIHRKDIVFYRSAKLSALHGVANFLMARYAEAARDFSVAELNNNKEIDYWRNMLADLLGNEEQTYDYLALNDDYISKYSPLLRQRLAVVAADRSIERKEYNTALKIFDTVKKDNLMGPIQDYVNYLLAVISAATGQEDEALKMWDKLADNHKSPFVQARAEFSRIIWGMEHGAVTQEQAIDRLERLRLGWHGDNLELKVLTLLGNMYAERKDYANAMRIWEGGVTSFPNTMAAVEMDRRMEDAFVNLFDGGMADIMAPLDILTLYYQYRNHVPGGHAGNQIVSMLADKLVAVDLLNEAAALLNRQMREKEKEERSHFGAKLATVYLINNEPQKALVALQDSVYGDVPHPLGLWRNRLLAEALSTLGEDDKALQVVRSDLSPDAERIRIGVYWQRRDWANVVASVEALLKARKDVAKPLTLDESEAVLKLALAYIFEDNTIQLQYLRDYFAPLMANNPYRPVFDFITAGDIAMTPTNFDDIMQSLSQTRSFLANYRARIQTAGLGGVMGTDKP